MANAFPQGLSQSDNPEVPVTEDLTVLYPFGLGAKNPETTTGTTLGLYGGPLAVDGVTTLIADGTVSLTNSATNYVEMTRAGVFSANTSSYTAGRIRLGRAVVAGSVITSWTDDREWFRAHGVTQQLSKSAAAGGTITLTADEARADWLKFTGNLPNNTTIVVPNGPQIWTVTNGTGGSPTATLTIKTSGGTGVAIPEGKTQIVAADGTNVIAVAPVGA